MKEEINWWRKYSDNMEKKHIPKNRIAKLLFYSKPTELEKELKESIFLLGFARGRNYELTRQLNRNKRKIKSLKKNH